MINKYDEYEDKDYNEMLLNKFPILKEKFDKYTSWQDGINTGSTLVYEDIFVPYIIEQLINSNEKEIVKIVNFIDEMVNSNNKYCFNLVSVAVLEALRDNQDGKNIRDFLKENSLETYDNLSIFQKH